MVNVAGAEDDHEVADARHRLHGGGDVLAPRHIGHLEVPAPFERPVEHLAVEAVDRLLASAVDVGQDEHVGRIEGIEKLAEQIARARVAMRLEEDHQAAAEAFACGRQRGANLGRMMAVVAHHHHAAGLAAQLEAAVDAAELAQRLDGLVESDAELLGDGDRGDGVERVMASGQSQAQGAEHRAVADDLTHRLHADHAQVTRDVIAVVRRPVGEDGLRTCGSSERTLTLSRHSTLTP